MQTTTLNFPHSSRLTYAAIKHLFECKRTQFSSIECNDDLYIVEARHGAWISPFSENVKMKVVATGFSTCKVVIESTSRSILNLLNWGANKGNVNDLSDYINNEVYRMAEPGDIRVSEPQDHSVIRFKTPEIRFKK